MLETTLVRIIDLAASSCLCCLWATHHYDTCLVVMDTPDSYQLGLIKKVGCHVWMPGISLSQVFFNPPESSHDMDCECWIPKQLWSQGHATDSKLREVLCGLAFTVCKPSFPHHAWTFQVYRLAKLKEIPKALRTRMTSTFFGFSFFERRMASGDSYIT